MSFRNFGSDAESTGSRLTAYVPFAKTSRTIWFEAESAVATAGVGSGSWI